jgi:hypothetical protein
MSEEWAELTTNDDQTRIFYRHDSLLGTQLFHQLEQRSRGVRELDRVALTDAEALAFARLLPEVQALVEAARHGAEHLTGNWPDAIGRVNASTLRTSGNRILRALAPFESHDGD